MVCAMTQAVIPKNKTWDLYPLLQMVIKLHLISRPLQTKVVGKALQSQDMTGNDFLVKCTP